jgi:phosphoglycolate phosphatase
MLGLVTGNVEAAAHIKLHRARLNRFFSFGGYGSDSPDRSEVTRVAVGRGSVVYGEPLGPERCLVVGDTPHDVRAAHGAGVACVAVSSGSRSAALRAAGADWVIESLVGGLPEDSLD